jgi:hypothetical protein
MFQTKVLEKIKTHILCSVNVFQKLYWLCDNVEKYGTARWATASYMICRICFACQMTKARIQTHLQNIQYVLLFHGNGGYVNAPQCYFIRAVRVVFVMF